MIRKFSYESNINGNVTGESVDEIINIKNGVPRGRVVVKKYKNNKMTEKVYKLNPLSLMTVPSRKRSLDKRLAGFLKRKKKLSYIII